MKWKQKQHDEITLVNTNQNLMFDYPWSFLTLTLRESLDKRELCGRRSQ